MGFPNLLQMVSQENDVRYRDKRRSAEFGENRVYAICEINAWRRG
jgi:hypothetical protein